MFDKYERSDQVNRVRSEEMSRRYSIRKNCIRENRKLLEWLGHMKLTSQERVTKAAHELDVKCSRDRSRLFYRWYDGARKTH